MERSVSFDRASLPVSLVDILVRIEMRDQICWRVSRVLGSMLVFDFGGRRSIETRRGAVQVGEAELSVRNCFWTLKAPDAGRINSDVLDDDKMERLSRAFEGRQLTGCHQKNGRLYLEFGEGVTLGLDLTNRYEVERDEQIAEIRTALGHSISLAACGVFDLSVSERAQPAQAAA